MTRSQSMALNIQDILDQNEQDIRNKTDQLANFSAGDYDIGLNEPVVIIDIEVPNEQVQSSTSTSKMSDRIVRGLNKRRENLGNASTRNFSDITMASPGINVIVFGEAGTGKSSLVNLLADTDVAETSNSAQGCTFKSTGYNINMPEGPNARIWDTAGLEEGLAGTVNTPQAINNIYKLTRDLEDGVNLLIYCVRGRITNSTIRNYKMFKAFCDDKVPIALVVTGLEHQRNKDVWWMENAEKYLKADVRVDDHACITTLTVPEWADDYASSRSAVWEMIDRTYLRIPWKTERKAWLTRCIAKFISLIFPRGTSEGSKHLRDGLLRCGYSAAQAKAAVLHYEQSCRR
ncbi:hypothetical protein FIBSPDRAFT_931226 [Athelia psychrophila]|uniref:G domain-containing protein n=1 Tax=Athelia psychrophila TaxID=1759441 RepID=A0A166KT08_9AGAM|nr:hypothetical protein FIBSPDRAFT_931226 [Fibularhizoctonia sp. CBS 109695]